MRSLIALLLALILTAASVPMALARGHGAAVMRVELCSGHVVDLDAQGRPVTAAICPDCVPGQLALPVGPAMLPGRVLAFHPVSIPEPAAPQAAIRTVPVQARGPPPMSS